MKLYQTHYIVDRIWDIFHPVTNSSTRFMKGPSIGAIKWTYWHQTRFNFFSEAIHKFEFCRAAPDPRNAILRGLRNLAGL